MYARHILPINIAITNRGKNFQKNKMTYVTIPTLSLISNSDSDSKVRELRIYTKSLRLIIKVLEKINA